MDTTNFRKTYTIMHRGHAAEVHITNIGAQKAVAKLLVIKGWNKEDVEVVIGSPIGGN